jgi:hypothetical protein
MDAVGKFRKWKAEDFARFQRAEASTARSLCRGIQGARSTLDLVMTTLDLYPSGEIPETPNVDPHLQLLAEHLLQLSFGDGYGDSRFLNRGFSRADISAKLVDRIRMTPTGSVEVDFPFYETLTGITASTAVEVVRVSVITRADFSKGHMLTYPHNGRTRGIDEALVCIGKPYRNQVVSDSWWQEDHYILNLSVVYDYD